jgi:hypothetical protein
MHDKDSDTLSAGQPPYRCAGCGCAVIARAGSQPGEMHVCVRCTPYALGSPRVLELMHMAHDRGVTLSKAAETVRTLQAARYGKRGG